MQNPCDHVLGVSAASAEELRSSRALCWTVPSSVSPELYAPVLSPHSLERSPRMPPMSLIGQVTKVGFMNKTATVTVSRYVFHPKTGKVRPPPPFPRPSDCPLVYGVVHSHVLRRS